MKKNQKLVLAAVMVVVALIVAAIYLSTRPAASQGAKTVTVEVVHGDGTAKTFTYHTDAEYLGEVLLAEGLIEGDQGQFGLYITKVDGETADYDENSAYWARYEGEDYAMQGIDQTPIADGGTFSLVYTIG